MEKGIKLLEGTPGQVFSNVEALQEMGLDVPQVTLLAHELRKAGIDIREDILTVEEMEKELCQFL
jgi:energy-coupling factor transport system ATP-binding protein